MSNKKKAGKGSQKTFSSNRTMNAPAGGSHRADTGKNQGFQEHDPKNRLGDFEREGDHARTGNRGHQ